MADAEDLKSSDPKGRAGSSPALGTIITTTLRAIPYLNWTASLEEVRDDISCECSKPGLLISGPNLAGGSLKVHPNTLGNLMKWLAVQRSSHAIS